MSNKFITKNVLFAQDFCLIFSCRIILFEEDVRCLSFTSYFDYVISNGDKINGCRYLVFVLSYHLRNFYQIVHITVISIFKHFVFVTFDSVKDIICHCKRQSQYDIIHFLVEITYKINSKCNSKIYLSKEKLSSSSSKQPWSRYALYLH